MHRLRDVGGTSGGFVHFIVGLGLLLLGGYLLLDRISVHSGYWHFYGSTGQSFGITLIPVTLGFGVLFYNGRSILGWILSVGGLCAIVVGVIANLRVSFERTSLLGTVTMLALLGAGLGLLFRSLFPVGAKK